MGAAKRGSRQKPQRAGTPTRSESPAPPSARDFALAGAQLLKQAKLERASTRDLAKALDADEGSVLSAYPLPQTLWAESVGCVLRERADSFHQQLLGALDFDAPWPDRLRVWRELLWSAQLATVSSGVGEVLGKVDRSPALRVALRAALARYAQELVRSAAVALPEFAAHPEFVAVAQAWTLAGRGVAVTDLVGFPPEDEGAHLLDELLLAQLRVIEEELRASARERRVSSTRMTQRARKESSKSAAAESDQSAAKKKPESLAKSIKKTTKSKTKSIPGSAGRAARKSVSLSRGGAGSS